MRRGPPKSTRTYTLCPYTTRFRSQRDVVGADAGYHALRGRGFVRARHRLRHAVADAGHTPVFWHRAGRSVSPPQACRSEEHTSELQSLMLNSYAVVCLKNNIARAYYRVGVEH